MSLCLSVSLSLCLYISITLSTYLSASLSVCPFYLCLYLGLFMSLCLYLSMSLSPLHFYLLFWATAVVFSCIKAAHFRIQIIANARYNFALGIICKLESEFVKNVVDYQNMLDYYYMPYCLQQTMKKWNIVLEVILLVIKNEPWDWKWHLL